MVSRRSIEKHSRASKNFYKRGSKFELEVSRFLVDEGVTPVLVWPKILRERGLGQVDLMWIKNNHLYVCECKTGSGRINSTQMKRLVKSSCFMKSLFKKKTVLVRIMPFAKKGNGHYPFKVKVIKDLG